MEKILILCHVCAVFGPFDGMVFRVTPIMRNQFVEAPAWITKTPMFEWLVKDGSIKVAEQHISKKDGENDPTKNVSADGKDSEKAAEREAEVNKIAGIPEIENKPEQETEQETEQGTEQETKDEPEKPAEDKPAKPKAKAKAKPKKEADKE